MKRTLIQFDEDTYHKLRTRAFERRQSIAAVVREMVGKGLDTGNAKKYTRIGDFSSIGAGSSAQGRLAPASVRHDEAWAESLFQDIVRSRPSIKGKKRKK
jgi:hypothetical protein